MSSACDEEEEMIQDLLPTFVSARQVWSRLLSPTDHKNFAGCHDEHSFADWWCKTIRRVKTIRACLAWVCSISKQLYFKTPGWSSSAPEFLECLARKL
jgi:hypothetical protein